MGIFSSILKGVGNILGIGESSTKYARAAGDADIARKEQGLDYLKSAIDPRLEAETTARDELMGFLTGGGGEFVDRARESPFYESMIEEGRQGVGASLSATGNLRGGLGPSSFYQQDQNVLKDLVNQQLQGFAGLAIPTDVSPVSNMYSALGSAEAGKYQAIGQAKEDKYKNIFGIGKTILGGI